MQPIDQARDDFKANFYSVKGFLGVCTSTYWKPKQETAAEAPTLLVYVENVDCMNFFPAEFQGFECVFIVSPQGINPGCD